MIYSITGKLQGKKKNFFAVDVSGVGYLIYTSGATITALPALGKEVKVFCHLHVKEDLMELYGFMLEAELSLFRSLISVSGVGPRSALNIMGITNINQLSAAINEGRVDLLSRASGIGKKTAERITLELRGKLTLEDTSGTIGQMESDVDLEETLVGLGYTRVTAKATIDKIDSKVKGFDERLRAALKDNNK